MALRLRRGTDAERQLIIPETGELIYTTDTKLVYVGDGSTTGGLPVTGSGSQGLTELVSDTSPELGGDLDLNNFDIIGSGDIDITGDITTTGNASIHDLTVDSIGSNTAIGILLNNNLDLNNSDVIGVGNIDISGNVIAAELSVDTLLNNVSSVISLGTDLNLNGFDLLAVGNINVSNSIDLNSNNLENVGDLTISGTITGNITPGQNLAYNVGSPAASYDTGYFADVTASGTITSDTVITNQIMADDSSVVFDGATGQLAVTDIIASSVTSTQFVGDLVGSVFADESTTFFDATSNQVTADRGYISTFETDDVSSPSGLITVGRTQSTRLELAYSGGDDAVKIFTSTSAPYGGLPASSIELFASRGTVEEPIASEIGDQLTNIAFSAWNGSNYARTAAIHSFVDNGTSGQYLTAGSLVFSVSDNAGTGFKFCNFNSHGVFDIPVVKTGSYADITARDELTGLEPGCMVLVQDDGTGETQFQGYDGVEWHPISKEKKETVESNTNTSITLSLSDNYDYVRVANSSAITITVPDNASEEFPIGSVMKFIQADTGQITFSPASGVTINSADSALSTRVQYSNATLIKVGTDEWDLFGDLA